MNTQDCTIKVFHDNSSIDYTMRLKFRNVFNDRNSSFDIYFFSAYGGGVQQLITPNSPITLNPLEASQYDIVFSRINTNEMKFSGANGSGTTPAGSPFFNNTNYSAYAFGVRFVNNPVNDASNINPNSVLVSVLITTIVPSGVLTTTGDSTNTCAFSRPCVEGAYCDSLANACKLCDPQCRDCFSAAKNSCKKCHRSSNDFDKTYTTAQQCKFDHVDLSKYDNFSFEAPPSMNYRVTIDFWAWILKTSNFVDNFGNDLAFTIVYKDFMTIGLTRNGLSDMNVDCFPMESYFPYDSTCTSRTCYDNYKSTNSEQINDSYSSISSTWFHVRCAFSLKEMKKYLNSVNGTMNVPIFMQGYNDFTNYFKTFYRDTSVNSGSYSKVKVNIQGNSGLFTNFYLKGLTVFSEFLPQSVNLKYHKLWQHSNYLEFPQLLWILPLDDLVQDGSSNIASTTVYDYSYLSGLPAVQTTTCNLTFNSASLVPPKNFKRLNFIDLNNKYANTDISTFAALSKNSDDKYVFDDNKAYSCNAGFNLDVSTLMCTNTCPISYTRLPVSKPYTDSYYCNYNCNAFNNTCPSTQINLVNLKTTFTCNAGFLQQYFKCSNITNPDDYALHFSGTLKTHSTQISLVSPLDSAIVSVWIHPDISRQIYPPSSDSYLLLTNIYGIKYSIANTSYSFSVVNASGNFVNYVMSSSLYRYGWSHVIIYSRPDPQNANATQIYCALDQNFFSIDSYIVKYSSSLLLNKICFCNFETNANCCGINTSIKWMDLFYKYLRIFDGRLTNIWSVIQYDNFKNNSPKSILYEFSFSMNNMLNDVLTDSITGISSSSSWDTNNIYNRDYDNMFNYGANFSWNDKNPGKYASAVTITNSRATVSGNANCNSSCSMCYGATSNSCLKCSSGFGINGNSCKKDSVNGAFYYYKNPNNNNVSFSLDLANNVTGINTSEPLTVFFYLKLFGFSTTSTNNDVITLDSTNGLKFRFDDTDQSFDLELNNVVQFSYADYQKEFFGKWVPISLAMYRSSNPGIFPYMNSCTIGISTLGPLDLPFSLYDAKEFLFDVGFIGYVADVSFYFKFLINAFGYASQ